MVRQEEDYSNTANYAFLASHISNVLSSGKSMLSAKDFIGEFKPISLFNVKIISEATKNYIKMLKDKGIKFKITDDGKVEILRS